MKLLNLPAVLLFIPLLIVAARYAYAIPGGSMRLPAGWQRVCSRGLTVFLADRIQHSNDKTGWICIGCAVLIVLALCQPVIPLSILPPENFKARVVVLDLSTPEQLADKQFIARALIGDSTPARSPVVATGLVLVAGSAFSVVPVTTDVNHLLRYLNVASPALMPQSGRALHEGIAIAESNLQSAGVSVGQVVIVSSGDAPEKLIKLPDNGRLREIVLAGSVTDRWQAAARHYTADLHTGEQHGQIHNRLEAVAESRFLQGVSNARTDLRPALIGLALLLWLWLLRRRVQQ